MKEAVREGGDVIEAAWLMPESVELARRILTAGFAAACAVRSTSTP